jgi:hypothetical protein
VGDWLPELLSILGPRFPGLWAHPKIRPVQRRISGLLKLTVRRIRAGQDGSCGANAEDPAVRAPLHQELSALFVINHKFEAQQPSMIAIDF